MQSPLLRQFAFLLMLIIALSWGVSMIEWDFSFYLIVGFAVAGSAFLLTKAFMGRKKYDPYDLNALRAFEENREIEELHDSLREKEAGYVLCISCHEYYPSHLPTCPRCKCCR